MQTLKNYINYKRPFINWEKCLLSNLFIKPLVLAIQLFWFLKIINWKFFNYSILNGKYKKTIKNILIVP